MASVLLFGIGLVIPTSTDDRHMPLIQSTHHMKLYQNTKRMKLFSEILFHACYAVAAIVNEYSVKREVLTEVTIKNSVLWNAISHSIKKPPNDFQDFLLQYVGFPV